MDHRPGRPRVRLGRRRQITPQALPHLERRQGGLAVIRWKNADGTFDITDFGPRFVTGLLGPSGSGKTTLMRAIVGVQIVKSGTVTVLGESAGSASLRSRIGYLTQAPSVYADLTVRENARYFASLYKGVSAADADAAVENVGLADAAGQLVANLSGGQRARASLACALVSRRATGLPQGTPCT